MDLAFSTSEIEFRDEIRTWLNEHKPSEKWLPMDTEIGFEQHRTWEHKLLSQNGLYLTGLRSTEVGTVL